jgi:hypothetical protein
VRADPITARTEPFPRPGPPRANAFAISEPDGSFRLGGLDRDEYGLLAEAQGRAQQSKSHVFAGAREVVVTMPVGELIAGRVVASDGTPVPAFTLLAYRRNGAARGLIEAKSFVDPNGKFELHVEKADYELIASATGWAPSPATLASAPSQNVVVKVSAGATLVGTVVSGADGSSVRYARVMREAASGGASAAPANAGTVTREDGSFVLTGIPPGSVSITIAADSFDRKIEAGMTANDGDQLGPIAITLTPLVPGATPKLELVGIGVALTADGDDLLVQNVIAHSGAQAAGIIAGDRIVAVDGASVTDLGLEGAIARVRGVVNTTVAISLKRGDGVVTLAVTRTKLQA